MTGICVLPQGRFRSEKNVAVLSGHYYRMPAKDRRISRPLGKYTDSYYANFLFIN